MTDVKKKKHIIEWIQLLVSLIYVFNPIDIIPDMPAIGWVDDFFRCSSWNDKFSARVYK